MDLLVLFLLLVVLPRTAAAVPVPLRAVEASAPAQEDHPLQAAVDGILTPENGWSLKEGSQFQDQYAVFVPDKPLRAMMCQLRFYFLGTRGISHFSEFEVNVTTDEKPSVLGRWMPLVPETVTANYTNGVEVWGPTTRIQTYRAGTVVTLRAQTPFPGITGFRLRLLAKPGVPGTQLQPAVGCSAEGNFLLTEFQLEAEPLFTSNLAFGRQLFSSGAVPADLPLKNLTDGFLSTYTYQTRSWMGEEFFFELDLGRVVTLDHIVLRGRADGAEADQLTNYKVEVLAESDRYPASRQWSAWIRPSGSHPPVGSPDILRASDGQGRFTGRLVRIYNQNPQGQKLQIAEVEVYPALAPRAVDWVADGIAVNPGDEVAIPSSVRRLAFTIASQEPGVVPGSLVYRWRIPSWAGQWHETGADGRVVLAPPPPPGRFTLYLQARHTDCLWDESSQPVSLGVALPWWREPHKVAVVAASFILAAAALGWGTYTWRVKRGLALAEQSVKLHRERLRIARDMHDEMGARLTYIALLADRTRREGEVPSGDQGRVLSTLADNARSAVDALDTIVWAVSPQHDTVGGLADYLCEYAPSYLKAAGVQCRLDIHVGKPEHALPLLVRHELLMAVKEALQNVVKHAGATAIRFSVRQEPDTLELAVTDDGRGFPTQPDGAGRNGLANMRQRLSEVGGDCHTGPGDDGRGACVRFTIPLGPSAPVT